MYITPNAIKHLSRTTKKYIALLKAAHAYDEEAEYGLRIMRNGRAIVCAITKGPDRNDKVIDKDVPIYIEQTLAKDSKKAVVDVQQDLTLYLNDDEIVLDL